jgi:hypothetical protein
MTNNVVAPTLKPVIFNSERCTALVSIINDPIIVENPAYITKIYLMKKVGFEKNISLIMNKYRMNDKNPT